MPPYLSIDEVLDDPDEFGLLNVDVSGGHGQVTTKDIRDAAIQDEVDAFFRIHGRMPDRNDDDIISMDLAIRRDRILDRRKFDEDIRSESDGNGDFAIPVDVDGTPASLDDIFNDPDASDLLKTHEALTDIRHVKLTSDRVSLDHRAELYKCLDFDRFKIGFAEMQEKLDRKERTVKPVRNRMRMDFREGRYFIHRGLLAYVAERTEESHRSKGKRDRRLRIVFSNGMEYAPLMSSFRKALCVDRTARYVEQMHADISDDTMILAGTVYVARSLSHDPEVSRIRDTFYKIGVTNQDVRRRVADARNDPTFLRAPVEIVATYDLYNLDRRKVENLLHRFFEKGRPRRLRISDGSGTVYPREWFRVLPEHVSQAMSLIRSRELPGYRYEGIDKGVVPISAARSS